MIPVSPADKPVDFDRKVKMPGERFLRKNSRPSKSSDWKGHEYWRKCIPDLWLAYKGICAYCAHWIPSDTGASSVDHFIPKSVNPNLAYDWSNFRLASARFNGRKQDVIISDPFTLARDSLFLDFINLQIYPNPDLPENIVNLLNATLDCLDLNNELSIRGRTYWLNPYVIGEINFEHLEKRAPFIAYELKRQGLVDDIKISM